MDLSPITTGNWVLPTRQMSEQKPYTDTSPKSKSKVVQSCLTLCNPVDYSPPGSSLMGFSRQGYWSGLPFPSPGDLPNPGIKPGSSALQADSLTSEPPGKPTSPKKKFKWPTDMWKRCSISPIFRKVYIKTTVSCHLTSVRMAVTKKTKASVSRDVGKRAILYTLDGNVN